MSVCITLLEDIMQLYDLQRWKNEIMHEMSYIL